MSKRVAIVTHVNETAGLASAKALARDGLAVVCHDATFGTAAARQAFEAEYSGLTASAESDPEALVHSVIASHGHVDVLFSNDVYPAIFAPIEEQTLDGYRSTFEALMLMPFALCRALAPHMKTRRTGNIILFSSAVPLSPYPGSAAYSSARAGAANLAVALCRELAPFNIQVNVVLSNWLHSELYYPRKLFETNQDVKNYMHAHVPMDRLGEQTEMAELIAFLASGKCNFVNGQEIAFTGGWPGVLGFPAPMPKRDVQP